MAALVLLSAAGASADPGRGWDRPGGNRPGDGSGHGRRGGIIVEPYIDLSRPRKPDTDDPEYIMAEVGNCAAAGVRLFVDCLRDNHGSIMIRRLEACLRSETIPDDLDRVRFCLPPPTIR
jgi:hypothetical protein